MKFEPTLHKLPSGLAVILDTMDLETTTISVLFKTGARDETSTEMGITHFCEHMLCKGTMRFPTKRAFDDFMDFNGGTKISNNGFQFAYDKKNAMILAS